jgi:hypothetical protein
MQEGLGKSQRNSRVICYKRISPIFHPLFRLHLSMLLRRSSRSGSMPSLDIGSSEARLRSASRISVEDALQSVVTSCRGMDVGDQATRRRAVGSDRWRNPVNTSRPGGIESWVRIRPIAPRW